MTGLTEEEKEILRKAEEIKRRMEEDIDMVPEDFGEPVKKKGTVVTSLDKENFVGSGEVIDEEVVAEIIEEKTSEEKISKKVSFKEDVHKNEKVDIQPDNKKLKGESKKTKKKSSVKRSKKKKSKVRRLASFIWKCIFVLLLLLVLLYAGARYIVGKTNYQPITTDYVRSEDVVSERYVKNYLIIGTDERTENDASRSDAMIVLSINEKTSKIVLTSILRDSYVTIPGYGQNRINAAYQFGGAALAIQTVEENFKIAIDGYIKIDFFSFVDIVDAVGGVYIDVDEGEKNYINGYLAEINNLLGVSVSDGTLASAGFQLLNGKQALSYARIRYIGTDFQRTERQREVIEAILAQAKSSNPMELYNMVNEILPQIDTSLDEHTMSMIMMKALFYLGYEIEQNRVPMDGTWNYAVLDGKDVINLNFEANRQGMLDIIYGE